MSSADRGGAWIIRNRRPTFPSSPPHPISRYFCKDSLMTPPPQHTTPLQASLLLLLPLQKFSSYHFLHFPFVFIRVSFVFTCVHSCSFVFIRVHSCSIRVPLVFTRVHVHSCSFVFTRVPFVFFSCSLVFIRVHSCSIRVPLVFTRVHLCSLVFHSCFTRVHSCSFVFVRVQLVFIRVHSCSFVFVRVHSCSDLCGVLDMIKKQCYLKA